MKPISLRTAALTAPLLALGLSVGCSVDDPTVGNTGGTTTNTAGVTATGGSAVTTGGQTTGGSAVTTGGQTTGGSGVTGGTGGAAGGSAPAGGTGGATGGTGGGTGGTGGGAGGDTGVVTIPGVLGGMSDFGNPGWASSWWVTGCLVKMGHDCITATTTCNTADGATPESKGARTIEKFPIGGTPGAHYKVTFTFNAVSEAKVYMGGTRDVAAEAADAETGISDTFYRDGTSPQSNYNVVKLTVFDDKGMEARHYYMNSFTQTSFESHRTFLISFTKSIVIVGGGHIEHLVQDFNCHAIDNCGSGPVGDGPNDCNGGRNIPKEPATTMLPPKYKDPLDGVVKNTPEVAKGGYPQATLAQPWHSQAGHLTVTAIELTTDPVTKNY
jgi:hypothetical protein